MTWKMTPVSELCEFAIDCVNKTAPIVDYETPYKMIRTTNVKGGFIDLETVRYVEKETFNKWTRRSKPKYGDVIFTREAPVGDVGRFTSHDNNVFLGQRLFHYRPSPELLDWQYLSYVLQSEAVQGWVHGIAFGATVPHIKVEDAEHLKIPYPPIETQRKIGVILATYDDLIENNTQRIKLLEEAAKVTYDEWFVRMKFPGHKDTIFDTKTGLPEGWEELKLGELLTLNYGKPLKAENRIDGEIPVYGSAGVVGSHNACLVEGPGIIVGRKGNVGSVFWSDKDFFPIDTVFYVTSNISLYLAFYILNHQEFINNDAAVPGLNRHAAYAKRIVLPDPLLIEVFDSKVEKIFAAIEILSSQIMYLKEARDILLPRLMTGMIDVDTIKLPETLLARLDRNTQEQQPGKNTAA